MSNILLFIMACFAVLGAIDRIIGNRMGLGNRFEEGISTMGPLALSMLGIICLTPLLADLLRPVIVPVFRLSGADPAMFAGAILACDMGAAPLAMELADDFQIGLFSGILCGSMLGVTIVFTIPAAMGILQEADLPFLAKGVLAGIVTIPLGLFAGGIVAGMELFEVLRNMIPILLFAGMIALGLWKAENVMIKGFVIFGKMIIALINIGLAAGIFEAITGIALIPGLAPIEDGIKTVGAIAIVLAGTFPLVTVLQKLLRKPLLYFGRLLGINEIAVAGLVASLANSIATFTLVKDMDDKGKAVNIAFAVSAAFVFGDHLAFAAGFAPEIIPALIVSKLVGGISAVAVALWMIRKKPVRTFEKT